LSADVWPEIGQNFSMQPGHLRADFVHPAPCFLSTALPCFSPQTPHLAMNRRLKMEAMNNQSSLNKQRGRKRGWCWCAAFISFCRCCRRTNHQRRRAGTFAAHWCCFIWAYSRCLGLSVLRSFSHCISLFSRICCSTHPMQRDFGDRKRSSAVSDGAVSISSHARTNDASSPSRCTWAIRRQSDSTISAASDSTHRCW